MDPTPSQLLRVSVINFWGRFVCNDTEEKFRSEHLAEDSKTAKFLALIYILSTVVFFALDLGLKGITPTLFVVAVARFVNILSSVALILRLGYAITPSLFDNWLLGWFGLNLAMQLCVHSARTAPETALSAMLFVWALTLLLPTRFSYQASTASATTIAFLSLIAAKKPEPALLAPILIALLLALTIGVVCSRRFHRARRQSFAAHLVERETGVLLEAALAQLKTLEGILSICSACKKIRQDDGAWTGLDEYVSHHSGARFSHGMCPECMARFYPHYSHR